MVSRIERLRDYFTAIKIQINNTQPLDLTNYEINVSGKSLYVAKLNVAAIGSSSYESLPQNLYIKFNKQNADRILLQEGMIYNIDFIKIFLDGCDAVYGNNQEDDILLIASPEENQIAGHETKHGSKRLEEVAAGTNYYLLGQAEGIYVQSFGNITTISWDGATVTFTNVPAGTFLPISPKKITSASTASVVVVYNK